MAAMPSGYMLKQAAARGPRPFRALSAGPPPIKSSEMRPVVSDIENDLEAVDEGAGVVMYCRSWCGDCARARVWLTERGIPFTEVDVETDPSARERAAGHNDGHLHTPTFEIGDGVCVDFRPDTLSELLGID